jgi:hypothetical protein
MGGKTGGRAVSIGKKRGLDEDEPAEDPLHGDIGGRGA